MSVSQSPGPEPSSLLPDEKARKHGRMGLTPSWDNIPWWGIVILIVGVIVGYSALTNHYYQDALYFIFDLPWNKDIVRKIDAKNIAEDGSWSYTFANPLDPGRYTLYGEYYDENGAVIGRSEEYNIKVPKDAPAVELPPLAPTGAEVQTIETSTPTIADIAPEGTDEIWLVDDFSSQPLRIANRVWIANGVVLTIKVTLIAFVFAVVIGLTFGIMRVSSGSPDLRIKMWRRLGYGLVIIAAILLLKPEWRQLRPVVTITAVVEAIMFLMPALPYTIATLYVEIVRGVPMLVIILYMGFAITPAVRGATGGNVDLRGLPAAVIGLAFGYGAYMAEVFRAGIQSISHGQTEAARAIGMSYAQTMRFVILPQAIRTILPPLGNDFIAMLKDSSLISVIALPETLQQGRLWISRNFRAFEGFNSVMMVYLVMTLMLSLLVRSIERRAQLPGK
jgi:ABC-type amino acid transport system permease subunit